MSCNTFAHKSQFVFLLCLLLAPLTEEEGDTFFVIEHPRCPAAPGSRDYVGHCFASLASELELELSALDHEPVQPVFQNYQQVDFREPHLVQVPPRHHNMKGALPLVSSHGEGQAPKNHPYLFLTAPECSPSCAVGGSFSDLQI